MVDAHSGDGGSGGGGRQKRLKGPTEDAWLRTFDDPDFDRNRLDSLRRGVLNPDLVKRRTLHCYCGNEVHLEDSWHVMVLDGTLVCGSCAFCHCCGREAMPNSRKLVSIDGMVLCYRCVKFYGYKRFPRIKIAIESMAMKDPLKIRRQTEATSQDATEADNKSNSEYYDYNVPRVNRCCYAPKVDFRRPVRRARYYDPPIRQLPMLDDPTETPPVYLAENSYQPAMLCPACNSIAVGPVSYVVPSMARVYHQRCFRCCNCKVSLAHGVKFAGINFQYCSCEVPQVWCTKSACRRARHMHHKVSKCHLGCIRPGGRDQVDYKADPTAAAAAAASLRRNRRRNAKKATTTTSSSQPQQPAVSSATTTGLDATESLENPEATAGGP